MVMFEPKSRKQAMALQSKADVLVLGGAAGGGKSFLLNMMVLQYLTDPDWRGILFRKNSTQLLGSDGLWDKGVEIFSQLPKEYKPNPIQSRLRMEFPTGATLKYNHMEYEKDKLSHQGLAYDYVGFDEATHFTYSQVEYLMSRLRGKSQFSSRLVLTANPDNESWLLDLLMWYLTEDGYPDENKQGVLRYFLVRDGEFKWADSPGPLIERYSTKSRTVTPKTFSFVASKLTDNPVLMANAPEYAEWLDSLNPLAKAQLRDGNWFVKLEGANFFKRENLLKADHIPTNAICCRAWDKAAKPVTQAEKFPDFTSCIKLYKTQDGEFFISGEFHPDNHDETEPERYGSFRRSVGQRDIIIKKQSGYDGVDCPVILPKDPGSAGEAEYRESAKKLSQYGFIVKQDPVPTNKSKLQRFMPFASSVENQLVYIVESTFPNKQTLEAFYKELESFTGERSTRHRHDDWCDAIASAYNYLSQSRIIPIVRRNQIKAETKAKEVLAVK